MKKYLVPCFLLIGFLIGIVLRKPVVDVENAPEVFKTVSHIEIDREDVELVFEDKQRDISYYVVTGNEFVGEGDTVFFNDDTEAKVTGRDAVGFYTERVSSVVPGMSGTAVRNEDGTIVGYVQQVLNNNVYCIWR